MTIAQKKQMGELLELYSKDVITWWKTEEDPEKKVHYQKLEYAIEDVIKSMDENLELDEW